MGSVISLESAESYQAAFRVAPEVMAETESQSGVGVYGWKTPPMEGFAVPESDALVVALHLGGSRCVRAVTDQGLSRSYSAPGLVTILPPGKAVAFQTSGSISLVTLHVPRSALGVVQAEGLNNPDLSRLSNFAFRDAYVSAGMEALLRAARAPRDNSTHYVSKVSEALLAHLARWSVAPSEDMVRAQPDCKLGCTSLAELLAFVDKGLSGKLTLDTLALRAGLSRAAFTRTFRASVGLSPHQYLSERRVAAAKKLLLETDFDLAYIAQETGFSSQSHFTGVFRDTVGCTPARFRQQG